MNIREISERQREWNQPRLDAKAKREEFNEPIQDNTRQKE